MIEITVMAGHFLVFVIRWEGFLISLHERLKYDVPSRYHKVVIL